MESLVSLPDLDALLKEASGTMVLFKHYTACPVSAQALEEFESFAAAHPGAARFVLLDLLAHRPVSNAIAQRLNVEHESPQAIVLRGGKVARVLNHGRITVRALGEALA